MVPGRWVLSERKRQESGVVVGSRYRQENRAISRKMGGGYKHYVNIGRNTVVRIVSGETNYLLKRKDISYGVDLFRRGEGTQ